MNTFSSESPNRAAVKIPIPSRVLTNTELDDVSCFPFTVARFFDSGCGRGAFLKVSMNQITTLAGRTRSLSRVERYESSRDEIKPGMVLLFKGQSLISRVIRWFGKSEYSHVGIVDDYHNRLVCLQSVASGLGVVLLSDLMAAYNGQIDVYQPTRIDYEPDKCVDWMVQNLGRKYSWLTLARAARGDMTDRAQERLVCSEAAMRALKCGIGYNESRRIATPQDVANLPWLRKILEFPVTS